MRFTIPITGSVLAVLFFALLNPALASPKVSRVTGLRYCKSNDPPAENIRETQLIAESARAGPNIQISALAVTTELKVWFHVVSNSTEVSDGNIPDEVLVKQVEPLQSFTATLRVSPADYDS